MLSLRRKWKDYIERNNEMLVDMLKAKIHRATVTQAELNYVGSITIDEDLLDQAGILEYEKVLIADLDQALRISITVSVLRPILSPEKEAAV